MPFDGLRVVSLESRRADEIAELIRRQDGDPFVAPSMREAPLDANGEAFAFADRLFAGGFDMMIFLTGIGARALNAILSGRFGDGRFAEALRGIAVVARGPKPLAALREMQVPVTIAVPEPNTWRELLASIANRTERSIAVQEYGKPNEELLAALRARGAEVSPVRVYRWAMPLDAAPLEEAARRIARGEADVALFTTSIQVAHLFRAASALGVADALAPAFRRMVVASIGPTTSEALEEFGIRADLEPSHPKMGFLVKEAADRAAAILAAKRAAKS